MEIPKNTAEFTPNHLKSLVSSMKKHLLPKGTGVCLLIFDEEGSGELEIKLASTVNGFESREILTSVLKQIEDQLKKVN